MINVFQPSVGQEELDAVGRVFERSWLGPGRECEEFEHEFADYLHMYAENLVLVNSCTSAIYLGLRALGVGPRDEVILPTIHFIGALNAILELGAIPILADVDTRTLNILPDEIERLISPRTKAVFVLHYGGHPCDVAAIREILGNTDHDIFWIEDAAGAVASKYCGNACGTLGDLGVWSLDSMKMLMMGDGGFLWALDSGVAERVRRLRNLGLSRYSGMSAMNAMQSRWWEFEVVEPSGLFLSNDLQAAIGREQLRKVADFLARRCMVWNIYDERLSEAPITLPPIPGLASGDTAGSYYLYWIQTKTGYDRDNLARHLLEAGIYTTFRYWPLHRAYPSLDRDFANADRVAAITLNLPCHNGLTDDNVNYICDKILEYFGT